MTDFVSRIRNIGVLLAAFSVAVISAAWADDYPKAYDSTYQTTIDGVGTYETHYVSDGKGHVRSESTQANGEKTICLMDYPNQVLITTMNMGGQKSYN